MNNHQTPGTGSWPTWGADSSPGVQDSHQIQLTERQESALLACYRLVMEHRRVRLEREAADKEAEAAVN